MPVTEQWLKDQTEACRQQWLDHLQKAASYEGAMEAFRMALAELSNVETEGLPTNLVALPEGTE